jgi:MFS family permease
MLVKPVTCGDSYAKNCGSKAGTGPSGFETVPFTLGEGLLSNVFGWLADRIGARTMLIAGPGGAALAYVWMALGQKESLIVGVIVPMTLLGLSLRRARGAAYRVRHVER